MRKNDIFNAIVLQRYLSLYIGSKEKLHAHVIYIQSFTNELHGLVKYIQSFTNELIMSDFHQKISYKHLISVSVVRLIERFQTVSEN